MAKLIPNKISKNITSPAEIEIFNLFQNLKKCDDWVVFHSYILGDHLNKVYSEIDFIIIAPNLGFFVLEVKTGRISKKDGVWTQFGISQQEVILKESPFEQARTGMYSVMKRLCDLKGEHFTTNFLCGYGVVFPDKPFNIESPEYDLVQVFDERNKGNIRSYIINLSKYCQEKLGLYNINPLTSHYAKEIENALKGDFILDVPIKKRIEFAEEMSFNLTNEQYTIIKGLTFNDRCLVHGGAGTGKTILATRYAKECIENKEKVGYFCYNLLLSEKLKKDIGDIPSDCYVGSFTNFLETLVVKHGLINIDEIEDKSTFYKEQLPCIALDALEKENILFDKIIIDESQDLINELYWDILDMILNGGLKNGKWFMFGDFNIQTIYYKEVTLEKTRELLKSRNCSYTTFNLMLNCRNTLNIQKEMKEILPEYETKTLISNPDEPKVKKLKYHDSKEMITLINQEVNKLVQKGIEKKDIVILSPYVLDEEKINNIKGLSKYADDVEGLRYSTISGFKGLESKVVFLINIIEKTKKEIFFIGCSRAKSLLYIFEKNK